MRCEKQQRVTGARVRGWSDQLVMAPREWIGGGRGTGGGFRSLKRNANGGRSAAADKKKLVCHWNSGSRISRRAHPNAKDGGSGPVLHAHAATLASPLPPPHPLSPPPPSLDTVTCWLASRMMDNHVSRRISYRVRCGEVGLRRRTGGE